MQIRNKIMVALTVIGTAGLTNTFAAEGQTAPATPSPASAPTPSSPSSSTAPVVLTGKIVVVDKTARTITLEANGKLQLVKVDPKVKMVNSGKLVTLEDLTSGQQVAVLTRVSADGSLQVVALSVEATPKPSEAAGAGGNDKGKAVGLTKTSGGSGGSGGSGTLSPPFVNFPNPANNLGPIRSQED